MDFPKTKSVAWAEPATSSTGQEGQRSGRGRYRACTRLTSRIEVRLTPTEHQQVKKRAKESSLSLSRFLAQSACVGKLPLTIDEREEIFRVRFLLLKAGANLNQLARQKNAAIKGSMKAPDPGEVEGAARIVRMLAERLEKRLKE